MKINRFLRRAVLTCLITVLLLLLARRGNSPTVLVDSFDESHCMSAEANSITMWTLVNVSSTRVQVLKRDDDVPSCLTIFSARLSSKNTHVVFLLDPPTAPDYIVDIPSDIPLPFSKDYILEVTLEFGHLIGGRTGLICGSAPSCIPSEVALHSSPRYSNETLQISVDFTGAKMDLRSAQTCDSFSTLSGYWQRNVFYPINCSLMRPSHIQHLSQVTWIHLIGDSTSRNIFLALQRQFRLLSKHTIVNQETNHIESSIAFLSTHKKTGKLALADIDLIVTLGWWFPVENAKAWPRQAKQLTDLLQTSLASFPDRTKIALSPSEDLMLHSLQHLKPYRSYVSFGSHTSGLSALGGQSLQDHMLNALQNAHLLSSESLRFLMTTAVQPANVPQNKFPQQDLMRNNVVITTRNQLLLLDERIAARVIDIQTMTETVVNQQMKNPKDSVHFTNEVYDQITHVLLTDAFGEDFL